MAIPRIFISSTCYDLAMVRGQLRSFVISMGYDPVMSDFSDVLYDPRIHTHTSCLKEVPTCDAVILVVGSRFGGKGSPEAISQIDFDALAKASFDLSVLKNKDTLSVTQLEILKAVQKGVPIYAFVDHKVMHDHNVYEINKSDSVIEKIRFPSIDKAETAKYIFEFINFLRLRTRGNSIFSFSKHDDIEIILRKQWAALFQRLLAEDRERIIESRKIDHMADQFESLKSAILASIPNNDARTVARAVVRFRSLISILSGLASMRPEFLETECDFDSLLKMADIIDVRQYQFIRNGVSQGCPVFICKDGTYYKSRMGFSRRSLVKLKQDWEDFRSLKIDTKRVVIDTAKEIGGMKYFEHVPEQYLEKENGPESVKMAEFLAAFDELIASAPDDRDDEPS